MADIAANVVAVDVLLPSMRRLLDNLNAAEAQRINSPTIGELRQVRATSRAAILCAGSNTRP